MHQGIQGKEVTFKDVLILLLKRFERMVCFSLAMVGLLVSYVSMHA